MRGTITLLPGRGRKGHVLGDNGHTYYFHAADYRNLAAGQRVKFRHKGLLAAANLRPYNRGGNLFWAESLERVEALERVELEKLRQDSGGSINQFSITHTSLDRDPPQVDSELLNPLSEVALRIDTVDSAIARLLAFRFFGGLTLREIAARTGQPLSEVEHTWQTAKYSLREGGDSYTRDLAGNFVLLPPISRRDLRVLLNHPDLIKTLEWRSFEKILAEVLEKLGYQIELQQGTKDGGIDIFALRNEGVFGTHRYIIQAKRWSHRVGIGPVRELLFLQNKFNTTKSCLAATTSFTKGAWQLAGEYRWQLELRDLQGIREWIALAIDAGEGPE